LNVQKVSSSKIYLIDLRSLGDSLAKTETEDELREKFNRTKRMKEAVEIEYKEAQVSYSIFYPYSSITLSYSSTIIAIINSLILIPVHHITIPKLQK
jgi:ACT domain-containing protein